MTDGPGELPSPRALAHRLRGLEGRTCAGRALAQGRKTRTGIAWSIRTADLPEPAARNLKEDHHDR